MFAGAGKGCESNEFNENKKAKGRGKEFDEMGIWSHHGYLIGLRMRL